MIESLAVLHGKLRWQLIHLPSPSVAPTDFYSDAPSEGALKLRIMTMLRRIEHWRAVDDCFSDSSPRDYETAVERRILLGEWIAREGAFIHAASIKLLGASCIYMLKQNENH